MAENMTQIIEELERMVDGASLLDVVTGLEMLCAEKAAFIRHSWQDEKAGKTWDAASARIGKVAYAISLMPL